MSALTEKYADYPNMQQLITYAERNRNDARISQRVSKFLAACETHDLTAVPLTQMQIAEALAGMQLAAMRAFES